MEGSTGLAVAAAILTITAIASSAAFERAAHKGTRRIFRAVLGLRLLFGVGIPLALYATIQVWASGDIFGVCVGLMMAIGGFILWPGTIILDEQSARQERWFGLKRITIPWNDVSYAGPDRDGTITIRARDGKSIEHTKYHVDPNGYKAVLEMYFKHAVSGEASSER